MAQSIAANDENINSCPTVFNRLTTRNYNSLSSFQKRLLNFYYKLHLSGVGESDYSRKEISQRLGRCHPDYVSRTTRELEDLGLLGGRHNGSRNKIRWITYEAFSMLESIRSGQMSDQIELIPYIDLLDQGSRNNLKILKEQQNCGQLEEEDLNEKLNIILDKQRIPYKDRSIIKHAINQSQITLEAKKELTNRVGWIFNKNLIESKRAYFLKAIQNEERNSSHIRLR